MTVSETMREEAYNDSSDIQKALYGSSENAKRLYAVATTHHLTSSDNYTDFLIAVGDVVLGLVPRSELSQLLAERLGIELQTAQKIADDLQDFLAPLESAAITNLVSATTPERPLDVELNQVEAVNESVANEDTLAEEIAETEAAFRTLQPIRTMAHDMQALKKDDAPTHQAISQEDLLQPTDPQTTDNRWGT